MASMKNKKSVVYFLFISVFLGVTLLGLSGFAEPVFAQEGGTGSTAAAVAGIQNGDNLEPGGDNLLITGFKWLLYGLLWVLVGFVQVAASVFAWATRPEYISGPTGLLNLDSVYNLWKFIRDFFNLFFIFLLLFSAFATVFQIEQYGLKKNFLKIVLAAIAINFSFPLTRIIIDAGNVPMYFFADGIVNSAASQGNALMSIPMAFFQTTGMGNILLLPDPNASGTLTSLLSGVIFTFIFMITLFVLSMLFVVRLLKLVILLIFSPLGVAASLIPGLAKFGKDWWSNLLNTVFFGPAAMLMIVVALRFTLELNGGSDGTGTAFTQGLGGTAPTASSASQSSIITQGVFFIPIILMWMAMHVGNKFGIEGSKAVIGKADKVADWGKKQLLFSKGSGTRWVAKKTASPVTNRLKGYKAGIKDRFDNTIVGEKYWKERKEGAEARAKGFASGGVAGRQKEINKLRDKKALEEEKKFKDEGKSASDVLKELKDPKNYSKERDANGKDVLIPNAKALASANFLSKEKEFLENPDDLASALAVATAAKKQDLFNKLIETADGDALEMNKRQLAALVNQETDSRYKYDKEKTDEQNAEDRLRTKTKIQDKFKSKMKKDGKINYYADYIVEERRKELGVDDSEVVMRSIREDVYKKEGVLNMSAKDMAKQGKLLADTTFQEMAAKTWKPNQLNSVEKFVMEDGKQEALPHIETIRKGIESKGRNPGATTQETQEPQTVSAAERRAQSAKNTREAALEETRNKRQS